jgi:preprotein translocase subunit SecG
MEWLETVVVVVHVLVALALIGLILIQQGKGAEAGASFGGGASQTVFGSQGSGSFLTRTTSALALLFFITSFSLAIFAKHKAAIQSGTGLGLAEVKQDHSGTPAKPDTSSVAAKKAPATSVAKTEGKTVKPDAAAATKASAAAPVKVKKTPELE